MYNVAVIFVQGQMRIWQAVFCEIYIWYLYFKELYLWWTCLYSSTLYVCWLIWLCGIAVAFDGHFCTWYIFLANLGKWLTQSIQMGYGIIIVVVDEITIVVFLFWHCLYTLVLATSLMEAATFVTYILTYPNKCMSSNLGICYICGIWGAYNVIIVCWYQYHLVFSSSITCVQWFWLHCWWEQLHMLHTY